jgi:hypothetical protein
MDILNALCKSKEGFVIAGLDPNGKRRCRRWLSGDLREVELLVEAGFTPLEAIQISLVSTVPKFLGESFAVSVRSPRAKWQT